MTATLYSYVAHYLDGRSGGLVPCGDELGQARRVVEARANQRGLSHLVLYRGKQPIEELASGVWTTY